MATSLGISLLDSIKRYMSLPHRSLILTSHSLLTTGKYSDLKITCGPDTPNFHKAIVYTRCAFFERAERFPVGVVSLSPHSCTKSLTAPSGIRNLNHQPPPRQPRNHRAAHTIPLHERILPRPAIPCPPIAYSANPALVPAHMQCPRRRVPDRALCAPHLRHELREQLQRLQVHELRG
jgi:hypothetical protein